MSDVPARIVLFPYKQRKRVDRPESREARERREAMIAARTSGETLQRIADRYGVSRQRVHQLTARRDA
jgi:DNA invertase Pin-like site-specific DNA recombinase